QANGREGVGLLIRRKEGSSPVSLSRNIREEILKLSLSYGKDLDFKIVKDASLFISDSIRDLILSAAAGAAIAFIVVLIFLKNAGSSAILISSIPCSILMALLFLKMAGRSINIMSLGGLALGIGMLVDNSVVVLENLQKHRKEKSGNLTDYVISRTGEMAGSTFGSTLTSLVVFLPVVFLPGIIGALFTDLALAVSFSLAASFLVSITLVPVLVTLFSEKQKGKTVKSPQKVEYVYRKLSRFLLRKPHLFLLLMAVIFGLGCLSFFKLDFEFMPEADKREIEVTAVLPSGASMEWISNAASRLAEQAARIESVASTYSKAGGEADDTYFLADPYDSTEIIHLTVQLKPGGKTPAKEIVDVLARVLYIERSTLLIHLPENIITPLLGLRTGEIVVKISGGNQAEALKRGKEIQALLDDGGSNGGGVKTQLMPQGEKPQIHLIPDRDSIARTGLSLLDITQAVRNALEGTVPTQLTIDGREIDARVLLKKEDRLNVEKLLTLRIQGSNGMSMRLSDLVFVSSLFSTPSLLRTDRKDVAYVKTSFGTADYRKVKKIVKEITDTHPYAESMESSAFQTNILKIIITFLLAVFLLYLVLGAQFESFLLPLFLMLSLPLSFSGIFLSLAVTGKTININSFLGILVLLGVAVNNSIILFENYNAKIDKSGSVLISIYRGSAERIRPILITVLTTITALLPTAIDPTGTQTQSSMAVAIIGGLLVSTTLTVFAIPLIFLLYYRKKNYRKIK
ncbi:MAG: efflux RND transporter permease subunit, partial [Spirochaetota bacterium]